MSIFASIVKQLYVMITQAHFMMQSCLVVTGVCMNSEDYIIYIGRLGLKRHKYR